MQPAGSPQSVRKTQPFKTKIKKDNYKLLIQADFPEKHQNFGSVAPLKHCSVSLRILVSQHSNIDSTNSMSLGRNYEFEKPV